MRLAGAEFRIHLNTAARVGYDAGGRQIQVIDIALAAYRVQQGIAGDFFLALQIGGHRAARLFHAFHFFVEPHGHAVIAQMIGERLDDLGVREFEQPRPLLHQNDAHAERGEHARVLDADDTAAHDDQRLWNVRHLQDLVAIHDGATVQRNFWGIGGFRTCGDDDRAALQIDLSKFVDDLQVMRIDKRG